MLMAHPTVLRNLVDRYETLHAEAGAEGTVDADIKQRLQDTAYTLCVSTGTREIASALTAARAHMQRGSFINSAAANDASAA